MRYSTISQIGAFTALSPASIDWLRLDPSKCTGGSDAPLRTNDEPIPDGDGAYLEDSLDDLQVITLAGDLEINSAGDDTGFFAAEDALFAGLKAALDALKGSSGDLVHSGGTLSVRKWSGITDSRDGLILTVTFNLAVDVT